MIDLCIVSYNSENTLPRLFEKLKLDLGIYPSSLLSINVADNGSTDNSANVILAWQSLYQELHPEIQFNILLQNNVGYARACNSLAASSSGEIIALCNADIWMYASDIYHIDQIFKNNNDIHLLGPKQRDEIGRITHGGIFGTLEAPQHRGWRQSDPDDILYRSRERAVTISGSAYFIRRNVWDDLTKCQQYQDVAPNALGAFLPTKHYWEETYCSYHAQAHGYNVFYEGAVSIGHSWHASSPINGPMDHPDVIEESRSTFRNACDYHNIPHD